MCKLCFFNAWGTVSKSVFSLVLCTHTEYQNKTLSGKFNKVHTFLKKTGFSVRCTPVLTFYMIFPSGGKNVYTYYVVQEKFIISSNLYDISVLCQI